MPPTVHARVDPTLTARVIRSLPLLYASGADPALDRPAHVRSASGLVRVDERLAVIQDDANFVALVDPATGRARPITLPAGEGGLRQFDDVRGNKRFKLDLEACVAVPDPSGGEMLVGFGSGSTAMREKIVLVRAVASEAPEVRVVDASALYALLRADQGFAGSEMNIEGAVASRGVLRLFNRGNGAPVNGRLPVNATCDLDLDAFVAFVTDPAAAPPPVPRAITQFDLGQIDGLPLTFTDAALQGDAILYAAAAEASPDATRDGPVAGCAIGIIRDGGARFTVIQSADGTRYPGKIEGVLPAAEPTRLLAVIDRDDPAAPSELLEIALGGGWG